MKKSVLLLSLASLLVCHTIAYAQDDKPVTPANPKPGLNKPKRDPAAEKPDPAVVNPNKPVVKPAPVQTGPTGKPEKQSAGKEEEAVSDPVTPTPPAQQPKEPIAVTVAKEANVPPKAAAKAKEVVEKVGPGAVNWTRQTIEAKGYSVIALEKFPNKAQARLMAIRGARVDAERNLLSTIKGVEVTSETTVEDMITTNDYVRTEIKGFLRGAQVVGEPKEVDGTIEVRMRVDLYGPDGLSNLVYHGLENQATPGSSDLPTAQQGSTQARQQELGVGITPEQAMSLRGSAPEAGEKQVAFNLGKSKLNPQLFPVFVNEKGDVVLNTKVLYDTEKGQFPQWLQLGKEVMQASGFQKGVEVIDVVQNSKGEFVLPAVKNSTWSKVLDWGSRIGKTLLMIAAPQIGSMLK